MGPKSIGKALIVLLVCMAGQSMAQTTIPAPGFQPSGLAFDGTFLYVSELSGVRTIFKLDPSTGAVLGSFLSPSATGLDGAGNPNGLVFDGIDRLFVTDIAGIVYEIDTEGTTIFNTFSLPFRGGAIAFDGVNLYISDFDESSVLVTDRSGTPVRTFDSQLRPAGMSHDASTGHLWVVSEFDEKIAEITTDGELVRSCGGPREPGIQGLGGVAWVHSMLYIAEVSDPDPFTPPNIPGTIFAIDPSMLPCMPPLTITVVIDIKPGNDSNPLNLKSKGVIPVAILTTSIGDDDPPDFDATSVDPLSVMFGPGEARETHGTGHIEDVDGDGDLDLVLHFRTQQTGIQPGDIEASLTGETFDGQVITGTDAIQMVGKAKKPVVAIQNFPNPANPSTQITYQLPEASDVSLVLYNITGQPVRILARGYQGAGHYQVTWDGRDDLGREVSSGVYLYRFVSKELVQTNRMLLLK